MLATQNSSSSLLSDPVVEHCTLQVQLLCQNCKALRSKHGHKETAPNAVDHKNIAVGDAGGGAVTNDKLQEETQQTKAASTATLVGEIIILQDCTNNILPAKLYRDRTQ